MLKRIGIAQLRVGMHVHELCGSWMQHPFLRSSFRLEHSRDILRIADSGIKEAWIDTAKGLDLDAGTVREELETQDDRDLAGAASVGQGNASPTSMTEEMQRAARICARSKQIVVSMFREMRMGKAIEAENAIPLVDEITLSVSRNPGALISIARLKTADEYTYMHSVAVCALMISLARQFHLGDERIREAGLAGLLHDVGKAVIPNEILNKPGKLTDEEFERVKTHPVEGHRMLRGGKGITDAILDVCLHHHEKAGGNGYPDRLGTGDISPFSKMAAVCDVYDAITSDRPYKKGWDPAEAVRRMADWSKGHFDDAVFQAFVRCVGIYPVGALVRLASGRLGVVVDQSGRSLLTPKVKVFFSTRAQARIVPEIVDLGRPGWPDRIAANEDPDAWGFPDLEELRQSGA